MKILQHTLSNDLISEGMKKIFSFYKDEKEWVTDNKVVFPDKKFVDLTQPYLECSPELDKYFMEVEE